MRTERIEVRLDPETRGKLEEAAAARGSSLSELVRSLIERYHEEEVAGAARWRWRRGSGVWRSRTFLNPPSSSGSSLNGEVGVVNWNWEKAWRQEVE